MNRICIDLNKKDLLPPKNITKFNEMLENININAILNETNTNLAFKLLMDSYKSIFNYCFPFLKQNIEKISSHGLIMIFIY